MGQDFSVLSGVKYEKIYYRKTVSGKDKTIVDVAKDKHLWRREFLAWYG